MNKTLIASLPLVSCVTAVGLRSRSQALTATDATNRHNENGECSYCNVNWFSSLDFPEQEEEDHS